MNQNKQKRIKRIKAELDQTLLRYFLAQKYQNLNLTSNLFRNKKEIVPLQNKNKKVYSELLQKKQSMVELKKLNKVLESAQNLKFKNQLIKLINLKLTNNSQ